MSRRNGYTPIRTHGGYLPIVDFGLIGDGSTAALVGRDGSVQWLCVPRFDDQPLFCSILDRHRGGMFRLGPADVIAARQRYEPGTGVLVTELRSREGVVRIIDCLPLRSGADLTEDVPAGRGELLRTVIALEGPITIELDLSPHGGATAERSGAGLSVKVRGRPELDLQFITSVPLDGLTGSFVLETSEQATFVLRWSGRGHHHQPTRAEQSLQSTRAAWRRWTRNVAYDGPRADLVRRSAITLKMLDSFETGAVVAAPTSALPEAIGGPRNWDYRYAWVRDAAFSVYAFRQVGMITEAQRFLGWVLDAIERDGRARVLYTIDGRQPPDEWEDPELEGYRGSSPVRWGNAAADQTQHDAFGEIIDCAYLWSRSGGNVDSVWPQLSEIIATAGQRWSEPDHGIWEVRSAGRTFTYSAAMCQVALERGARIAQAHGLPGDAAGWRREARLITDTILRDSWDERQQSLTEHLGPGGGLDASLLTLPLRRVIDARHPKMIATVDAIVRRLGAGDGLLYRYLPDESPDGIAGHEGAFLLCSFWLVDNLAMQGRLDEAAELYESLCDRAGPLGLLAEEIDPTTGDFLGNFPQAFSHVGVISSGCNLARLMSGT